MFAEEDNRRPEYRPRPVTTSSTSIWRNQPSSSTAPTQTWWKSPENHPKTPICPSLRLHLYIYTWEKDDRRRTALYHHRHPPFQVRLVYLARSVGKVKTSVSLPMSAKSKEDPTFPRNSFPPPLAACHLCLCGDSICENKDLGLA